MNKYYRNSKSDFTIFWTILIGLVVSPYKLFLIYVILLLIGLSLLLLLVKKINKLRRRKIILALSEIDFMSGEDFELYLADLLKNNGFHNVRLTEKYDMGIDIIAEKHGIRWGIQVKRYSGLIKVAAVRQVVTALNFYNCDRSMVITNSYFSKTAISLAKSNNCVLIDRKSLLEN
jgi:HJR/Mrr/RecB family endonuclease